MADVRFRRGCVGRQSVSCGERTNSCGERTKFGGDFGSCGCHGQSAFSFTATRCHLPEGRGKIRNIVPLYGVGFRNGIRFQQNRYEVSTSFDACYVLISGGINCLFFLTVVDSATVWLCTAEVIVRKRIRLGDYFSCENQQCNKRGSGRKTEKFLSIISSVSIKVKEIIPYFLIR